MEPIDLFGSSMRGYSDAVSRQRRVNCFYDLRQDGDASKVIVRGTPGKVRWVTLPNNLPARGMITVGNYMYVPAGGNVYRIDSSGNITSLTGSILNGTNDIEMATSGLQILVVDGVSGYAINIAAATITTIGDINFPSGCVSVDFLDGKFIAQMPGTKQFNVSASYDCTNWTPLVFGTKEQFPDNLSAVEVLNGVLLLFGTQSLEFWQDAGTSPLQFQRIPASTQTWGLAAHDSRAQINNTLAFLGQNPQGGIQVLILNGYTPTRISNTDLENIISKFSSYMDAVAYTYIVDGHPMYQLTFPTANRSFLWDALTGIWYEVQSGLALLNRDISQWGCVFNTINYASDSTNGNIYSLQTNVYTENGAAIMRLIASKHVRMNGDKFAIPRLFLNMETGVGLQSGQGVNPQIMIRVSKDKGRTFPIERYVNIGAVGHYRTPTVSTRRLGASEDFVFEFCMTDPVKFTIIDAKARITKLVGK